jgi:acyl carrier protein
MTRAELQEQIFTIFVQDFEFKDPKLDDNLRDVHGFDSIDAIELLSKIEILFGFSLTREEKEKAMEIRTISDILDYLENIQQGRSNPAATQS